MDFTLTEEQRDFQALLRTFVDKEIVPVARDWERSGRYPTEIVEAMKEMGYAHGGLSETPETFLDGKAFDPKADLEAYAASFEVKTLKA